MNLKINRSLVLVAMMFLAASRPLASGAEALEENPATSFDPGHSLFESGRYELALNQGVFFSPFIATGGRPTINYTISELQLGRMVGGIKGHGFFRGNYELAAEAFGSAVFHGRGDYVAGGTLWVRYNFLQPGWRVVPFAQLGAGICFTDIDRNVLGENFNFNLNLGFGVRYLLAERWALMAEYRYQHLSDAYLSRTNVGINAHGPIVGVSYFF